MLRPDRAIVGRRGNGGVGIHQLFESVHLPVQPAHGGVGRHAAPSARGARDIRHGPSPGLVDPRLQRYRVQSSGTGIEFDPTDNFYTGGYVTSAMQAVLSIPQSQDANFAAFLSDGLKAAWANTNGTVYPALRSIGALVNYNGKGPSTVYVPDYTCDSYPNAHKVILSTIGQSCGRERLQFRRDGDQQLSIRPALR